MDIATARSAVQPFITFFTALTLSGVGVTVATQILKAKYIPVPAQKYPRLVAAVASVIATFVAIYASGLHFVLVGWWQWLAFGVGSFVVSAMTYNHIVKGSALAPGSGVAQE
jgi:hypothetical protein